MLETAYSGSEPTSTSNSTFVLGGYTLKYMYTITTSDSTKYLTPDFMPVATDSTVSAAATDGKIESLIVTAGSGYTNGTYYAAIYGDGTSQGTSSGAIVRITVSGGAIASFGLTAGTDTTIHDGGVAYTYGTVNLGSSYTFSDNGLSSASSMGSGSGGVITVEISPKSGHGYDAVKELGWTLCYDESNTYWCRNQMIFLLETILEILLLLQTRQLMVLLRLHLRQHIVKYLHLN